MKIIIDVGHPAHIHFFNPIIKRLEKDGHKYLLFIREKDCSNQIAQSYQLNFITKGKGSYSFFFKIFYLIHSVWKIYKIAKEFKSDIFLSFASPYAGLASRFLNKPHIVFDDTESDPILQWIYKRFSTQIITPTCFQKSLGNKHIRINSYKELSYLSPNIFQKNTEFKKQLGFQNNQEYILVRLVNHGAMHDMFSKKWNIRNKTHFILNLANNYPIVISSEIPLPENLKKYKFKLPEKDLHQAIANAKLIVGESATVATESAILGIPALFIDYNTRGYVDEIEKGYSLIKHLPPSIKNLHEANFFIQQIMDNPTNDEYLNNRQKLLIEKEDIVSFFVNIIQTYT